MKDSKIIIGVFSFAIFGSLYLQSCRTTKASAVDINNETRTMYFPVNIPVPVVRHDTIYKRKQVTPEQKTQSSEFLNTIIKENFTRLFVPEFNKLNVNQALALNRVIDLYSSLRNRTIAHNDSTNRALAHKDSVIFSLHQREIDGNKKLISQSDIILTSTSMVMKWGVPIALLLGVLAFLGFVFNIFMAFANAKLRKVVNEYGKKLQDLTDRFEEMKNKNGEHYV